MARLVVGPVQRSAHPVDQQAIGQIPLSDNFQFFLALAIGVVGLKRKELAAAGMPPKDLSPKDAFKELTGPMIVH